ncbi:hypothetical protein EK21DRAFT_66025 [Setomelanomma holmii]|uniref:Endonuclease/exonuclease/phosphatase domain-containing protein n=1 Tax=Setomelanomma holmii TaxID=210430 RepID=A0A9P4HA07_9PLEO|nr:hypothetical protein EK21DRAFT_66025 [Setomelanomma holmii]
MAAPKPKLTPIQEVLTAALNSPPAQRREDAFYEPKPQNFWSSDGRRWLQTEPTTHPVAIDRDSAFNPKVIRLVSWNIDVLAGFAEERMRAALQYLEQLISSTPNDIAVVVFLQEMGQSDLKQIQESLGIMRRFNIAERDGSNWLSPLYGTTTLIDRRLKISNIFRVPWISKFARDGLFVDLAFSKLGDDTKVLRLCNTHLESLVADPPIRPLQLAAAAEHLQKPEVAGALLAGDLNAIQPFDRTLHFDNNLHDAYLDLGGKEDSDAGYTWGQQVPQWMKDKFGCSRMDKILFQGAVQPVNFERIGMGVKVAENVMEEVEKEIEGGWVTDHYGIMGEFTLTDGWQLQKWDGDCGQEVRSRLS